MASEVKKKVRKRKYKPEKFWGNDCHCPEPCVCEDGSKCEMCGGNNPKIMEKRRKKK